eukprot:CAMPEP_0174713198 /NCGR_PEP_ID=MMETSP1094-20130205/13955_1 /TAXON_ID=156173 /ORGANISM="Chrysochromulina brevifilum, Strain UTEX LB 985" /LENGTH=329 /DNA_ID=CAMNT_0015912361 /DNA_START=1 /DNA_END=986 /DNA_ORIENTATION=+
MPAMITVFILLTGEWVDALEPTMAIEGGVAAIFFIFIVMLGKYLLMNLLVAVILTEFAEGEDGIARTARTARITSRTMPSDDLPSSNPPWPTDYSLLVFGPRNGVRILCRSLIRKPWFDQVVIAAIIISSICLTIDTPRLDHSSQMSIILQKLDLFFTALFFCEMSTKIIATSFLFGRDAYLKSAWNQVDFVIVMISLVVLLAESVPQLRPLRVLRIMRVLRPLRLISRNAGMKLIITSLFKAMPGVSNVFGVVFMLQVVFVILGMQLFSGTFGSCNNPAILTMAECQPEFTHLYLPNSRTLAANGIPALNYSASSAGMGFSTAPGMVG